VSHTKELIEQALDELEKYLEEKRLTEDLQIAECETNGNKPLLQ